MSASVEASTPGGQNKSKNKPVVQMLLNLLGPFIGLILVTLMFSINPDVRSTFLTVYNFKLIASQTVITAIGALGMTLIIMSRGIDLSVGSLIALTSVIAALILSAGFSPVLALLAALGLGAAVGAINGGFIAALKVPPFIVTLGTLGIVRGVALWIAHGQAVNPPDNSWGFILNLGETVATPSWLVLSQGVWLTIVAAVITAIILRFTVFGRYIIAIGSNEVTSRLSGLRVDVLKVVIYAVGGLFFGLAGIVQLATNSQGDPTNDMGKELDIIAAVVIGGGSLDGGEGSVLGSILGALIMVMLRNGAVHIGWPDAVQQIIIGAVIVAAVALDRLRHRGARAGR